MFLQFLIKPSYTKCSFRMLQYSSSAKIVRSIVPHIEIPKVCLQDFIWKNLHKWEHKTALVCAETQRSYRYLDVHKKCEALSSFLRCNVQLKEKDTVAIVLPNLPEYPIIMLGAIQAGMKVTPVNSNYTADEIYKQLLNSESKFVFTTNQLWPQVHKARTQLKYNIDVAIIKQKQAESLPAGTIDFNEMVGKVFGGEFQRPVETNMEDVIVLPYSSGTTGLPKGVELSHKNLVANLSQMSTQPFKHLKNSEGAFQEVVPALLPWYHIYGMVAVLLNGLASGSKLVIIPTFHPKTFTDTLDVYKPTIAFLAPPTVLFLLNSSTVPPRLIEQLRKIMCGAAPLGATDISRLYDKTGGKTNIIQLYGLTEASPLTHSQTELVESGLEAGGCGLVVPNTECMIRPHDLQDTADGSQSVVTGELYVRGPQVMKGYFRNPDATTAVIDCNGWLKTGDIGYLNENGHLFITDRLKELIKVKGFQVAPAELEEVLRNHPDIEDAGVVGISDPRFGEVPKAFVVPRKNTTLAISTVQEYVAAKLAHYKQLRGGVVIVDSIPKSAAGKILRRSLRAL